MAFDRQKLLGLHSQQIEAFQKAKKESKMGWLPPVSPSPYQCEFTDIDANVVKREGENPVLVVTPCFTIVGAHTDANGKSLQGRKFRLSLWNNPNTGWVLVQAYNRLFDGSTYPEHPGEAAIVLKDTIAGQGNVYEVSVKQTDNPDYPTRATIGKLVGVVNATQANATQPASTN